MLRRLAYSFLFMLISLCSIAQQRMAVSGIVTDATTGHAVAGVSISGAGQTVVTNADGLFLLKSVDQELTTIIVTHVGYSTERINVADIAASSPALAEEPLMRIRLQPATIRLNEVLVVSSDARSLVSAAIRKITDNYSRQPELLHCFYRETAMKRQRYIMVAEGVVDMYKTGYGSDMRRDRVAIRKGRRLLSPRSGDTLSVKVTGGPIVPVQLDIVKNPDILLSEEELDCYELRMETPTYIADRMQYVVSLEPRYVMPYALYRGRLYIDQETLAFTRAELSLDMSDRDKATAVMLVRKPAGVRFRPKELSLLIDYRHEDGLTRISYVRTIFRFNCDWRRRLFATSFTATCEMAVTSHHGGDDVQPIRGRESFDQRDAFFDQVEYFRDPDFWQDYNIIEPTESLDRAIDRLLRR